MHVHGLVQSHEQTKGAFVFFCSKKRRILRQRIWLKPPISKTAAFPNRRFFKSDA
jgi:hypothetical protein